MKHTPITHDKYIQIMITIGKDDSTLDEVQIFVWKDHQNIPTRQRTYKYSPERAQRIVSALTLDSRNFTTMQACYFTNAYYI